jgi:ribonuclease-3
MTTARPKRTRQRAAAKASKPLLGEAVRAEVEAAVAYRFREPALLEQALTHASAVPASAIRLSNQRLEFLGDRVLNLVIAERLLARRKDDSEGELAPRLNNLVRKSACAEAVRHLGLQRFIFLSEGEADSGGRERESVLGDACEAIIGAIFLDGGLGAARKFIERAWAPQFGASPAQIRDPKTRLQEWAQGRGYPLPEYVVTDRSGPDHAPVYEVEVCVAEVGSASASGTSKREAEQEAAARLLETVPGDK